MQEPHLVHQPAGPVPAVLSPAEFQPPVASPQKGSATETALRYASLLLCLGCLGLSIALVVLSTTNQRLQTEIAAAQFQSQAQAEKIEAGNATLRFGPNILQDTMTAAVDDKDLRLLLIRQGLLVEAAPAKSSITPAQNPPQK